jgi:hypothetical protein
VRVVNLIDWTMETARELRMPNDSTPVGSAMGDAAIAKAEQPPPISGLDTDIIADHPVIAQPASPAPEWPSVIQSEPAAPEPAPSLSAADLHAGLLQAIVDSGIHTSKADRYRAIDLRWILRDIAADRLSPIGRLDLQVLMDMKLVELRSGVPHLTHAGVAAIG